MTSHRNFRPSSWPGFLEFEFEFPSPFTLSPNDIDVLEVVVDVAIVTGTANKEKGVAWLSYINLPVTRKGEILN